MKTITLIAIFLVSSFICQAINVNAIQEFEQQQPPNLTPSDLALAATQQVKGFLPTVNLDNQSNKSKLDVNVPLFFNMFKDDNKNTGQSRLDLSVLNGLVTVNRDKERKPNGSIGGPLVVTVLGIPVYQGTTNRGTFGNQTFIRSIKRSSEDGNQSNVDISIVDQFSENFKKTNEKTLKSIADTFDRLMSLFRGNGIGSNINFNSSLPNITEKLTGNAQATANV